jgi:O-antigen/teichoic acid export membrane protein
MYYRNIIKTIASKSGILFLNFLIVVLTTRFWGAEGKGIISILITNVSLIVILNNVMAGSTIAFHTPKIPVANMIKPAIFWIVPVSVLASILFFLTQNTSNFWFLLSISVLTSVATLNLSIFVGKEKMSLFNTYNFLLPLLTLIFMLAAYYTKTSITVNAYYWGYLAAYLIVWLVSTKQARGGFTINTIFKYNIARQLFSYGWKNEMSNFLQFLNYRFAFYIIVYYMGYSSLGVFSIAVALAESVWIIANSISLNLYAKILNSDNIIESIKLSKKSALTSFAITLTMGIVVLFVPVCWFTFVFGNDFAEVKHILLLLYPGILAMSFSNIYGHFLAATGQMKPLIIKSAWGLVTICGLSFVLIPVYGTNGACIAMIASHFVTSAYVIFAFHKNTKK